MTRCNDCNSILTKTDMECFICGQPVPGAKKPLWRCKRASEPVPPVTTLSNLLLMASLVLILISLMCGQKMSVCVSASLSIALLIARIVSGRLAARCVGV